MNTYSSLNPRLIAILQADTSDRLSDYFFVIRSCLYRQKSQFWFDIAYELEQIEDINEFKKWIGYLNLASLLGFIPIKVSKASQKILSQLN